MFFLQSKLPKTKNIFKNFQRIPTYGLYRVKKIEQIFSILKKSKKGYITYKNLIYLKFFFKKIYFNPELSQTVTFVNSNINKSIQSYKGVWLFLNLPLRGQRTWTNASTQRLLAHIPRKWHFTQKKNWRKFSGKNNKKTK